KPSRSFWPLFPRRSAVPPGPQAEIHRDDGGAPRLPKVAGVERPAEGIEHTRHLQLTLPPGPPDLAQAQLHSVLGRVVRAAEQGNREQSALLPLALESLAHDVVGEGLNAGRVESGAKG